MTSPGRKTVFVDGVTHLRLRLLASTTGRSAGDLIAEAVADRYAAELAAIRAGTGIPPPGPGTATSPGRRQGRTSPR